MLELFLRAGVLNADFTHAESGDNPGYRLASLTIYDPKQLDIGKVVDRFERVFSLYIDGFDNLVVRGLMKPELATINGEIVNGVYYPYEGGEDV